MKLFLRVFLLLSTSPVFSQPEIKIELENNIYDYGVLLEGADSKRRFKLTNIGDKPLVIMHCKPSGGLIVQWPKQPIMPGESDFLFLNYYSTHHAGPFNRTMTISSNATNSPVVVRVKGEVKPPNDNIPKDTPAQ